MEKMTSSADIARQTLIQLAKRSQQPTPDNYTRVYNEIAGDSAKNTPTLAKTLQKVLLEAGKTDPKYNGAEKEISTLLEKQDWPAIEIQMQKLLPSKDGKAGNDINWSVLIRTLLKQLETSHKGITLSRKKEGLSRVLANFSKDSEVLGEKINALMRSWGNDSNSIDAQSNATVTNSNSVEIATNVTTGNLPMAIANNAVANNLWREMLIKTLDLALIPQLEGASDAHQRAHALLVQMRNSKSDDNIAKCAQDLKNILLAVEMQRDSSQKINLGLLDLLRLLTKSMSDFVIEDKWLKGQMAIVSDIVNRPVSINTLYDAESSLKELIHKQYNLKPALQDAKDLLKQMAVTFMNRLIEITDSTGDYHHKIETHQKKLTNIEGIDELNHLLKVILEDTRAIGLNVQRSRDAFEESQKKVDEAELKIQELTAVLDRIGEVANQDYLTGTLNRRGMDEALATEFNRADRYNTTLSIAMMDIDHFKKLNDTLGHATGDEALVHFAQVVMDLKRSTDVIARYGGEEFIIILPATTEADAIKVVQRVQRELTKNFFMHNNERVMITFSAGVAERGENELIESIIPRADAALYEAKHTGRNRVVGANKIKDV